MFYNELILNILLIYCLIVSKIRNLLIKLLHNFLWDLFCLLISRIKMLFVWWMIRIFDSKGVLRNNGKGDSIVNSLTKTFRIAKILRWRRLSIRYIVIQPGVVSRLRYVCFRTHTHCRGSSTISGCMSICSLWWNVLLLFDNWKVN
jgi:hypothetical protein